MHIGFSTNSLGDVDPADAVPLLHGLGYRGLAITPDRHLLDPFAGDIAAETGRWRTLLDLHGLSCVVETGARHLLDPRIKHEPTLVSADRDGRERRIDFLRRAVDLAARLGARCVSLWSGVLRDAAAEDECWDRLTASLRPILDHAGERGVALGFEPEPGMFVDTVARFGMLLDRLGRPDHLRLTVDVGHLVCMGEFPVAAILGPWLDRIVNVHIDDMLPCRHEHLPLGTGEVEFGAIIAALATAGYDGGLHVELPRQSHRWLETAGESAVFLQRLLRASSIRKAETATG